MTYFATTRLDVRRSTTADVTASTAYRPDPEARVLPVRPAQAIPPRRTR